MFIEIPSEPRTQSDAYRNSDVVEHQGPLFAFICGTPTHVTSVVMLRRLPVTGLHYVLASHAPQMVLGRV